LAFVHLRDSLTKGNLWIYILKELKTHPRTPADLKRIVEEKHGFSPAVITFYTVIYKLRREGLVRRSSSTFRSTYEITTKGTQELTQALDFLKRLELVLES
jgi:DNA-binding PadR family transcriptional regulator